MQTVIHVEQLSKSYGNLLAVDKLSLSVKRGTVYGLLGANGAGKSTTIECILGTKMPTAERYQSWDVTPKKTDTTCFRMSAFSSRRAIISRKLKFQSYVKKPPAFIKRLPTGRNFVNNLE